MNMFCARGVICLSFGLAVAACAKPAPPTAAPAPSVSVAPVPPSAEPAPSATAPEPQRTLRLPTAPHGVDSTSVLGVEIDKDGALSVNGQKVADDQELVRLAKQAHDKDPETRAIILADRDVSYGRVISIIDLLRQASIKDFAFAVSAPSP